MTARPVNDDCGASLISKRIRARIDVIDSLDATTRAADPACSPCDLRTQCLRSDPHKSPRQFGFFDTGAALSDRRFRDKIGIARFSCTPCRRQCRSRPCASMPSAAAWVLFTSSQRTVCASKQSTSDQGIVTESAGFSDPLTFSSTRTNRHGSGSGGR